MFIQNEDTKMCSVCKQLKSKSRFVKRSQSKDGLAYECKDCHKIRRRRWELEHPEKREIYRKRYIRKNIHKKRQRDRELATARRRARGAKPRPKRQKYFPDKERNNKYIDVRPIEKELKIFIKKYSIQLAELANMTGIDHTNLSRILESKKKLVTEETVDKLLIAMNKQNAWHELYPVKED